MVERAPLAAIEYAEIVLLPMTSLLTYMNSGVAFTIAGRSRLTIKLTISLFLIPFVIGLQAVLGYRDISGQAQSRGYARFQVTTRIDLVRNVLSHSQYPARAVTSPALKPATTASSSQGD